MRIMLMDVIVTGLFKVASGDDIATAPAPGTFDLKVFSPSRISSFTYSYSSLQDHKLTIIN